MLFPELAAPRLIGIARLAAEAPALDSKRRVEYRELTTRSLIARCASRRMPFHYVINPYRGCEFGCKYCYARYTHEFMELRDPVDFERLIFAKQWNEAGFRRDLAKVPLKEAIAIGTGTDPYQPAERRYGVTRRILEVLAGEEGRSIGLVTKSGLVARDADLLARIARSNVLHVHLTITTLDERLAGLIEPMAPRPRLRVEAVRKLSGQGVPVGVLANPIMPLLTDSERSIDAVAREAKRAGAVSFGAALLFLKPCALRVFLPFLEAEFPKLARRYRERYSESAFLRGEYAEMMEERVGRVRARYGYGEGWPDQSPELWPAQRQLALFGKGDDDNVLYNAKCEC